jgi:Mn2+/Fe2+ NRAMP family transporter
LRTLFSFIENYHRYWIIGFIITSTSILTLGFQPVTLLVLAGSINGLILPLSLGCILLAAHKVSIIGDYKHPVWLTGLGWIMVAFTAWMGWNALVAGLGNLIK